MLEVTGNLWDYHAKNKWIAITTNGYIKSNGCAVMGAGVAAQCAKLYPKAPQLLGEYLIINGNIVQDFMLEERILAFPVKHRWWQRADIKLIERSAHQLVVWMDTVGVEGIYLPRPGCGNGQLLWAHVLPVLKPILDNRFTIVELPR